MLSYKTQYSRKLASLDYGSLWAVGRAGLGQDDAVASLNIEVVPAIFVLRAVIPQDGHHLTGVVPVLGGSSGHDEQSGENNLWTRKTWYWYEE